MNCTPIPIVSFFSGGGFMDMGFEKSGFHVVYANEFNDVFADIHDEGISTWAKFNHKKACLITSRESILSLNPNQILKEAFPDGIPHLWGIIGGPPCQDFTLNGRGDGFDGERGKMTYIFYNRIKKMLPPFFVMENVIGLLRQKHKQILDTMLFELISKDYYLDRKVLNALEFGVPQYRRRVFLIGLRKDAFRIKTDKESSIADICSFNFNWPKAKYPNAYRKYAWPEKISFGSTNVVKPQEIPEELCVASCVENLGGCANTDEFLSFKKDAESRKLIDEGDIRRRSFKRLHRYRYSPTTCFGNNEVFLHPYENRRLSVREALRIQGVDDSYELKEGRLGSKFKVIGNGVPVPLAAAVASSLKDYVNEFLVI